jgi:hypothetical protein
MMMTSKVDDRNSPVVIIANANANANATNASNNKNASTNKNENNSRGIIRTAMTRSYPNFLIILIICILCSITIYLESNHLLEYVSFSTASSNGNGGNGGTSASSTTITIKEISTTKSITTKSILTATTTPYCEDKIGTFQVKGIIISGNKKLTCQKVKKKNKCHQKGNNGKQLFELCPIQCQTPFCGEDTNNSVSKIPTPRATTSSEESNNVATINGHDDVPQLNKKKKKFILIHIGPSKTGTTSIVSY